MLPIRTVAAVIVLMIAVMASACEETGPEPREKTRTRPVTMAALTTILGMIPLLGDVFFQPMAVTIMFGLGFATLLTLIVVPVLFALFHRVRFRS